MKDCGATGWWTFDAEGPVMVHAVSGERVAYIGKLTNHQLHELTDRDNWHCFEYRNVDLNYPFYVRINDRQGPANPWLTSKIEHHRVWLADFERSAQTAEGFKGKSIDEPIPYGMWVRLREAVEDAFRCWPSAEPLGRHADRVILKGGWSGDWSPGMARLSAHRNNLFNRFGSTLITDIPREIIRYNPVPLDTEPVRFWNVFRDRYIGKHGHFSYCHVKLPHHLLVQWPKCRESEKVFCAPDFSSIKDAIISLEHNSVQPYEPRSQALPPKHSPGSLEYSLSFSVGQDHTGIFGHTPRFDGRYYHSPASYAACATEVFSNDPATTEIISAQCCNSPMFALLQTPDTPLPYSDIFWLKHSFISFDRWRLGRECLEAFFGTRGVAHLCGLYFPGHHSNWREVPLKALLLGCSYVGGDISLEPYCLTFQYTQGKPAGMQMIAEEKLDVTALGSALAQFYNIN